MAPDSPSPPELPTAFRGPLEDFLDALRVEAGLAANTLRAYRGDLERFAGWAGTRGLIALKQVDAQVIVDHLAARRATDAAESSVARGLVAVRMWFQFLVGEGDLKRDPTALIPTPTLLKYLPHALSPEDVERLLSVHLGEDWRSRRDRALLEVLYATGARVSEAVGLRTDGLDPKLRVLRLHGKGDKMRVVPVGARAQEALAGWLEHGRSKVAGTSRKAEVFLTHRGAPLDRTNAWRIVKESALKAGLPASLSPHGLRHSFATHLLSAGADLRSVQEMLGHASIRTTEVYTHLDTEHVRSIHRLHHPRG
jgi:integrase/recombinase XerD